MILKPCPFCQKPIPRSMKACPYCHRDEAGQPVKMDTTASVDEVGFFEDDLKTLSSDDPYLREQAVVRMAQRGFGIVQNLISILADHAKPGLASVAKTLGRIRDKRSIGVLAQAARQGDDELRTAAVWALTQFREPEVLPILLTEVERPPVELQSFIAHALGNFQDTRVVAVLSKLSKHSNREVAFQAVCALGETGDMSAIPSLRRAFNRKDALVCAGAESALRHLGVSTNGRVFWKRHGRLCLELGVFLATAIGCWFRYK